MRHSILGVCILLIVFLSILPLSAQDRGAPTGSNAGRGAASGASSATTSMDATSGAVSTSGGTYTGYSDGMGNRAFGTSINSSTVRMFTRIQGISFYTTDLYNDWYDYYDYLLHYYSLSPWYFTRFIRNREPLITPEVLKLTLRQPLSTSAEMLKLIDDLQMMYADLQAGKDVDRDVIAAKSQMIRTLARQIRQDRTISLIDLRKETDLCKNDGHILFNADSIAKLREMTLGLVRQLNEMYELSSSSTVSVDSFQEPSFTSMTKGIEKVCKAIEKSSKDL